MHKRLEPSPGGARRILDRLLKAGPQGSRLPFWTKFFYGIGGIPFGIKDAGFTYLLLIFYNQVVGMPSRLVGLAIMMALMVDAFVDISIGVVSDHWRSRWGRRHPFMYFAAVPFALSYFMLWRPPSHLSTTWMFVYLLVTAIAVRSFMSFFEIPNTALGAELSSDYDERTKLYSWRTLLGWWAGLATVVLALQVFLRPDAAHPIGLLNAVGFMKFGDLGAIAIVVTVLISSIGTHNRIKTLHAPHVSDVTFAERMRELASALLNRSFMSVSFSGIFTAVGLGIVVALNLYMNAYFWGLSNTQISILAAVQFASALITFNLAPAAGYRYGKRASAIGLRILAYLITLVVVGLRLLGFLPGNGTPLVFGILFLSHLFSPAFSNASVVLMSSMVVDVADVTELRTGRRFEGLFVSASSFMQKMVSGVGIFASGIILWFVNFPVHAVPGKVDSHVIWKLGVVYLVLVGACHLIAMIVLSLYRITRESHEETLRQIAVMRQQGSGTTGG